jgi:hypothetical protein
MYVLYMCPIGNRMSPEQVIVLSLEFSNFSLRIPRWPERAFRKRPHSNLPNDLAQTKTEFSAHPFLKHLSNHSRPKDRYRSGSQGTRRHPPHLAWRQKNTNNNPLPPFALAAQLRAVFFIVPVEHFDVIARYNETTPVSRDCFM